MKHLFLPEKGNFYKANLHCHSTFSDGKLSPERLKQIYKENGYSVLAISDHEAIFDHSELDDPDFLTIPAYEREINAPETIPGVWDSVVTCHLCFYPRDRHNICNTCFNPDYVHPKFRWMHDPELHSRVKYIGEAYVPEYSVQSINHIIDEAVKNGFIVTLNHLQWSQERYEQYSQYHGMFAMEIYNTGCERSGLNEYNSQIYDLVLRSGHQIKCVAADDNHNNAPLDSVKSDSFGGYVMIKTENLEYDSIFSALEKGEFYSSTGPEIGKLYLEDDTIHIETSAVRKIRLLSANRYSAVVQAQPGKSIWSADFAANGITDYFRIEITDNCGEKAYTNAYFRGKNGSFE